MAKSKNVKINDQVKVPFAGSTYHGSVLLVEGDRVTVRFTNGFEETFDVSECKKLKKSGFTS